MNNPALETIGSLSYYVFGFLLALFVFYLTIRSINFIFSGKFGKIGKTAERIGDWLEKL